MIVVRRIAGESYDLESGESSSKALVLSNGHSEVLVAVDDETAMRVVQLMAMTPSPDLGGEPAAAPVPMFVDNPPPPSPAAGTNNPALRVAPYLDELEDELNEYGDPESGTSSI